jgi:hypothetical protein
MDLVETRFGDVGWNLVALNGGKWKALVNILMNFWTQ